MRTAAIIYYYGRKYKEIGACAVSSFKKYHPDVDLYYINDKNEAEYEAINIKHKVTLGVYKLLLAAEIMKKYKYDKIISLGADTITCSRLDEFLDDNEHDILASLDYPYQLADGGTILCPNHETHLNADVLCFNRIEPIIDIAKVSKRFPAYAEQGGLNYIVWSSDYNHSCRVVDAPYAASPVVYNVRSKGNICLPYEYQNHFATTGKPPQFPPYEKPWGAFLNKFYVKENQLYNYEHKQIKMWHYCEGFGLLSEEDFIKIMNNYIQNWFNNDTKKFFKEHCNTGDFFEKEFTF